MTSSPASGSDPTSTAFARLHPALQRWVHAQGWTTLHDAQERAVAPILAGDRDLIISAATAAGKTEAAFLPIASALAASRDADRPDDRDPWAAHDPWAEPSKPPARGIEVLYLSPLKALINDQYDRLELLCDSAGVPVHRWHGDVSDSAKRKARTTPEGVLLITPESLEAQFVNRGHELPAMLAGLRYIVVDELHSFLATPRGAQLQSLMSRVELAVRRPIPRIGLSATLGDMASATRFLRPSRPDAVTVIESTAEGQELRLQLRGYRQTDPMLSAKEAAAADSAGREVELEHTVTGDRNDIAAHLYGVLRGRDNLVFANARRDVEIYADLLARRCEADRVPNEFWAHHGSLAKDHREHVEAQLKDRTRPVTAVCTSTLEMGIDIGSVASVAQVGPPPSVAALRQRLGRSGRRDEAAVLRIYVSEPELDIRSAPSDQLRCGLVQTVAMVQLLLERWLEPPDDPGLNLSTLVQQILSTIAQHGGAAANELHRALCGPGPFEQVDPNRFTRLLRAMAAAELLAQAGDGTLLHGPTGERIVNHYAFYSAFHTPQEWRLIADGRPLGSLPITQPLHEGGLLIFGGRRWKIARIDSSAHVVELTRAAGGVPPNFGGQAALVGDRVRAQMVDVYRTDERPPWLDTEAAVLLTEARDAWRRLNLDDTAVLAWGDDTVVIPWLGDRALLTAGLLLGRHGLDASLDSPTLTVADAAAADVVDVARTLLASPPPDPVDVARGLENVEIDKWDWVLDDDLAAEATAARLLDLDGAWNVLRAIDASPIPGAGDKQPDVRRPSPGPASRPGPDTPSNPPEPSPPARRTLAAGSSLRDLEFCVIDVETTGFSPRLGDRVVEVAAVRLRGDGDVLAEWSTLLNPGRDLGATHVHGITAADVLAAPAFIDVAGDLTALLDGAVLAAHNLRFDWGFIAHEYARAGHFLEPHPGVCTIAVGSLLHPGEAGRKLAACCERIGYRIPQAHAALDDARAAAALLRAYIEDADRTRLDIIRLGCQPLDWPARMPNLPPSGRTHPRGQGHQHVAEQASYLAALVNRLDDTAADPDTAAYLDLLDRALEDRRLTETEAAALHATAIEWGLGADAVTAAHRSYFDALVDAALADGVITDAERDDLHRVCGLLDLPATAVDQAIGHRAPARSGTPTSDQNDGESLAGLSVCFTGTLRGTIDGRPITRAVAQQLARDAGMQVRTNVTRDLDVLVVADPDSLSGKARRAQEVGTRVIAEPAFWRMLGRPVRT